MQSYLINSNSDNKTSNYVNKLVAKLNLLTLEYDINKIDDVRKLEKFTRLKVTKPTGIIIRNIHKATKEALNALLKNLEEPQPDLYYILAVPDIRQIIPTILSRCQVITLYERPCNEEGDYQKSETFLSLPMSEKFLFIDKIKDRNEAINFLTSFIIGQHYLIMSKISHLKKTARILAIAEKTKQSLLLNGNITLHLTDFIINI